MEMIHIVDGPPLYTNCYLLVGNRGHAAVIDPAAKESLFVQALESKNAVLTHILLTHGHHDHIGSVQALRQKYGAKLYMNPADAEFFDIPADEFYTDMGAITVDDMTFRTIFTPGHSPGSTCIQCGGLLFTGDTLFAGDIGYTHFPGGSDGEMKKSLKKLLKTVQGNPKVLPGHEDFSTFDEERRQNPSLRV